MNFKITLLQIIKTLNPTRRNDHWRFSRISNPLNVVLNKNQELKRTFYLSYKPKNIALCMLVFILCFSGYVTAQQESKIEIRGEKFIIDGLPFEYTGLSFFNALYNPVFNNNNQTQSEQLARFKEYGINVLRVWCQWDNQLGYADAGNDHTIYNSDGSLKPLIASRLRNLVDAARKKGIVIELVLFARESWDQNLRLSDVAAEKAVENITLFLKDYRNVTFQIWNEFDHLTPIYFHLIKKYDPIRLVTNSPGFAGELGSAESNKMLDFLTPHTSRTDTIHWELAASEVKSLLYQYRKPVVDDEPARKGTAKFGGPKKATDPVDNIMHIYNVWKAGGYIVYHHDMFQTGYGTPPVPTDGIPSIGFSVYHDEIFNFLKRKDVYLRVLQRQ